MNRIILVTAIVGLLHMSAAIAATTDNIEYKSPASWVLPPPTATASTLSTDAAVRFDYLDNQVRITPDGVDQEYTAYRLKIMKPEGLAAGNLTLGWRLDTGGMTVHYVHLIRNGQTSDILAATKFIILQREAQLEQSVLTGQRTASLQVPGLQVGDVIARAVVSGKVVWLDATRVGDRYLENLPSPYRWALPLAASGATLEKIQPHDDGFPSLISIVDIDASAGFDQDAHVHMRNIMRGDEAFATQAQLAGMTPDDADRALKKYWSSVDWVTPSKVSWRYHDRGRAVELELTGDGNLGWKGDRQAGHSWTIIGAGFYAPAPLRRPADQDQSAPWSVSYPRFRCWATTIHLPKAGEEFGWSLYAEPMDQRLGGILYWRNSGISGNVVRTVMSSHSYELEATPEEAAVVNRGIPTFNNNMSNVAEEPPADVIKGVSLELPFDDKVDWLNAPAPCSPPNS